jgi:hypothetical protein
VGVTFDDGGSAPVIHSAWLLSMAIVGMDIFLMTFDQVRDGFWWIEQMKGRSRGKEGTEVKSNVG